MKLKVKVKVSEKKLCAVLDKPDWSSLNDGMNFIDPSGCAGQCELRHCDSLTGSC